MLEVSLGSLKQTADYNFHLEFLILPSSGRLKPTCDIRIIHFYAIAALALPKKKPKKTNKCSLRNEEIKANRASETEEQRKERPRITHKKDKERRRTKKTARGKEKVVRNRRPRETVPGHS